MKIDLKCKVTTCTEYDEYPSGIAGLKVACGAGISSRLVSFDTIQTGGM